MTGDDDIKRDIAAALPPLPPPAPARREAAIAEAMRRFDAGGEAAPAAPSRGQSAPLRRLLHNHPQLAGLIAASLALIVGAPIAWRELSNRHSPVVESGGRDAADTDDSVVPPPRLTSAKEAPRLASNDTGTPRATLAQPPSNSAPTQAAARPLLPPAPILMSAPPAPPTSAPSLEPSPSIVLNEQRREARAPMVGRAPAAAPQSPANVAMADRESINAEPAGKVATSDDAASIVVTGARRRASGPSYSSTPGDWNACTIDDPRQSLAACRSQINPSAHGNKGEAAAFLAEGLTQAWQGEAQRAIAAFDRAIALTPRSSLAWLNRGLARANARDSAGALADLDRAARLAPGSARIHYARGRLLRALGQDQRAKAEFERAAEIDSAYDGLSD
jgi:hypothetical protein